ncbi:hypothetical protein [Rugamonas sp.]|uniref:hypothetical protein n=1 Tax=Rugamonas sp. TaxID=1926287 RepID=UPI0025F6A025|nr:hypothetical protein [Rugamonas sp.]
MALTIKTTMLATMLVWGAQAQAQAQSQMPPATQADTPAPTSTAMPTPAALEAPPVTPAQTQPPEHIPAATSVAPRPPAVMPNAAELLAGPLADHSPSIYKVPLTHSIAEADAKLADVAAGRAAAANEYAASEAICYNKFFVNICLDKAKEKRRVVLSNLRAIEVEANHYKREDEVKRRDAELVERARKDAEDEAQRQAAPVKAPAAPSAPPSPVSGPSVAQRIAEHDAKAKRQQADEAAKVGQRAANAAAFAKKKADTAQHAADVAAKKAAKAADTKKKADAAAASAAASASAPQPKQ